MGQIIHLGSEYDGEFNFEVWFEKIGWNWTQFEFLIARQSCLKWDFSNMFLAQTIISLNTYQNHERGIFQASTGLLSLWFISHIRPWCRFMNIREICLAINLIERYIRIQNKLPKQSFLDWANFIKVLTLNQIQWRINWPKIDKARITS